MASMSLQAAYDQARQWLESNDLDRAIGLAQHILERYPQNLEAHRILGEAYLASRQLDRAQASFERVLRSDPENIPAHVGLGITYERRGKIDRAVVEFEQALEIKPDMPELRSQLLRLYTEAWGSEHAQLRLSRAGLARLYAKGHMLSQAITEFRQVIADQPDRYDARVALIETLWRNEQENDAIALCKATLVERPELLKANLILGYLEKGAGHQQGDQYWDVAAQMDPYRSVAQMMFDTLPAATAAESMIEEWNEESWQRRKLAEQQEHVPATRPMEVAATATHEPESHRNSFLEPHAPVAVASDDFLASLLALDTPSPSRPQLPPAPPVIQAPIEERTSEEDLSIGNMRPFSLADLGFSEDEVAGLETVAPPVEASAIPEPPVAPAAEPEAEQPRNEDGELMRPFSLADLGLTEDEIAGLESLDSAPAPGQQTTPAASDDMAFDLGDLPADLQPFSFDELDRTTAMGTGDTLPHSLQPFTLEDSAPQRPRVSGMAPDDQAENASEKEAHGGFSWQQRAAKPEPGFVKSMHQDLPPETAASIYGKLKTKRDETPRPAEEPLSPMPLAEDEHLGYFSLDNEWLREDNPASGPGAPNIMGIAKREGVSALDMLQPPPPSSRSSRRAAAPVPEVEDLGEALSAGAIAPFSLADLGLSPEEIAELGLEDSVTPSALTSEPPAVNVSRTPSPAPEVEDLEDALATGEIMPFSLADLGLSDDEIAALGLGDAAGPAPEPPAALPAANSFALLDLDDLEPVEQAPAPVAESQEEALVADENLQPFSLADLGMSDDEINDMESSLEDSKLGLTEDELAGLDQGGDVDLNELVYEPPATTHGSKLTPVSEMVMSGDLIVDRLIALGRDQGFVDISDIIAAVDDPEAESDRIEEIGRLLHEARVEIRDGDEVIDMDAEYAEEEEYEPEYSPELAYEQPVPTPPAEEEALTPFSLADLGLSADEIAMLGLEESVPATPATPEPAPPIVAAPVRAQPVVPPEPEQRIPTQPVAPPPPAQPVAPPPARPVPAQPVAPPRVPGHSAMPKNTGNEVVDEYLQQLEAEPQNYVLRLSVARFCGLSGMSELAFQQYRLLIRQNAMLDDVLIDVSDLIMETEDPHVLRQLYRTLGDVYSKQGHVRKAVEAYNWTAGAQ